MSKYTVNGEGWSKSEYLYRYRSLAGATNWEFKTEPKNTDVNSYWVVEQRYTDQQIELLQKDDGWIVWTAGDGKPDSTLKVTLINSVGASIDLIVGDISKDDWDISTAYRLLNNDLYINGKRVVLQEGDWVESNTDDFDTRSVVKVFRDCRFNVGYQAGSVTAGGTAVNKLRKLTVAQVLNAENAKLEQVNYIEPVEVHESWPDELIFDKDIQGRVDDTTVSDQHKDLHENDSLDEIEWGGQGSLPLGIEIEFAYAGEEFEGRTTSIIAIDNGEFWAKLNGNAKSNLYKLKLFKFRPLQTEREKVVEKALIPFLAEHGEVISKIELGLIEEAFLYAYDAGILKLPEGE